MNLRDEAFAAQALLSALREESAWSEQDAEVAVESETNLLEALEAALLANAEDAAHVDAIGVVVANLKARASRKAARIERRKGAIMSALEIAGLQKIELATATLSVGKGHRKVIIIEEEAIPAEFMREKVTRYPDKEAIGKAIAEKRQVPGAELSNTMPSLTVRVK
jgi:hypothetical protein